MRWIDHDCTWFDRCIPAMSFLRRMCIDVLVNQKSIFAPTLAPSSLINTKWRLFLYPSRSDQPSNARVCLAHTLAILTSTHCPGLLHSSTAACCRRLRERFPLTSSLRCWRRLLCILAIAPSNRHNSPPPGCRRPLTCLEIRDTYKGSAISSK